MWLYIYTHTYTDISTNLLCMKYIHMLSYIRAYTCTYMYMCEYLHMYMETFNV